MNEERLYLLTLAALVHDIGKLFERGDVFQEARTDSVYVDMCPKKEWGPSYLHSAYTAAFCDWLEHKFVALKKTEFKEWKIWASAHHKQDEMGLENSVIRISDGLSASEREEGGYYRTEIHRRTLLEPVTERVFLSKNEKLATLYRFPLSKLSSRREDLFPMDAEALDLEVMEQAEEAVENPGRWNHLLTKETLTEDYRILCEGLKGDLSSLGAACPDMSLGDLIVSISMLLERYTAMVPSATNVRHPDISLYDHLRSTAAIAQALYLYQLNQENPHKGIKADDEAKWLLVCGDFSGIQRFIYNLTNKGAAKGLRGRSFYVQQLCSVAADFILRDLKVTCTALLYNSGGKFYLLLPSHLKKSLFEARKKINEFLIRDFNGEVFLGLGTALVTADMFKQGGMHSAWDAVSEDLKRDRLHKFKEFLSPKFFEPMSDFDPTKSCAVCGSRKIEEKAEKCGTCKTLENVGSALRSTEAILTIWENYQKADQVVKKLKLAGGRSGLVSFALLNAHCILLNDLEKKGFALSQLRRIDGTCVFLNEVGEKPFAELPLPNCAISSAYIGKWESNRQVGDEGVPWDFEDYAKNARGIKRLGVLRMDVDNLGSIFAEGLRFPEREPVFVNGELKEGWGKVRRDPNNSKILRRPMASISRIVTLSRQLNHFFSGYVPRLLKDERFNKCQVVYAGGDDLFVIGSWDQLPLLAKTVHDEFSKFCCGNPDFSISGGLILQRGKYPIYKGAQLAGKAEEEGKSVRKEWGKALFEDEKNGFCFLGVPVLWEDFDLVIRAREMLEMELENKERGFISYLLNLVRANKLQVGFLAEKEGIGIPAAWKKIEYGPWRWHTAYQLRRRYKDSDEGLLWAKILLGNKHNGREALLPVYTWLEMPLRWAEFLHR